MFHSLPSKRYVITYRLEGRNVAYDIVGHIDDSRPRSGNLPPQDSFTGHVGHIIGPRNMERMTSAPPRPHRLLPQWAWLVALALCVGQSIADTHLHLDETEEEVCTPCAISETEHVLDVGGIDARLSEWRRSNSAPVLSAITAPRPDEVGYPRAPPISVS